VATNLAMGLHHHADADLLLAAYNVPLVGAAWGPGGASWQSCGV
jgi:hypothetical protein